MRINVGLGQLSGGGFAEQKANQGATEEDGVHHVAGKADRQHAVRPAPTKAFDKARRQRGLAHAARPGHRHHLVTFGIQFGQGVQFMVTAQQRARRLHFAGKRDLARITQTAEDGLALGERDRAPTLAGGVAYGQADGIRVLQQRLAGEAQ